MGMSNGMTFDQRGCLCCDDPGKREITRREKRPEICFCALAATDHQHEHIRKTSWTSGGVNQAFYKKEGTVRKDGPADVSENFHGIVIRLIMNNALQ